MSTIYKNVVKMFVTIALFLKESIILLRGQSVILYNKIANINTYIYTFFFFLMTKLSSVLCLLWAFSDFLFISLTPNEKLTGFVTNFLKLFVVI